MTLKPPYQWCKGISSMQDRFLSGIESSKLHFKIVWIKSIEWSNSIVYKSNRFLSTTYVHSSFFMLMYENICTYIYYMAFYAHFSQSIFLHTYASMYTFLAVGATDICCTKVCLSYVCKSEMWQNKQLLGYFFGGKIILLFNRKYECRFVVVYRAGLFFIPTKKLLWSIDYFDVRKSRETEISTRPFQVYYTYWHTTSKQAVSMRCKPLTLRLSISKRH